MMETPTRTKNIAIRNTVITVVSQHFAYEKALRVVNAALTRAMGINATVLFEQA
jgi:hypothetical protein